MASNMMIRGLGSLGAPLRRQWVTHVAQASCCRGQAVVAAGLVARHSTAIHSQKRSFHGTNECKQQEASGASDDGLSPAMESFKDFFDYPSQSPASDFRPGETVTIHGFISKRRDLSKKNAFVDLLVDAGPSFQFRSSWEAEDSPARATHSLLKSAPAWSSVALTGRIDNIKLKRDWSRSDNPKALNFGKGFPVGQDGYELTLLGVHLLNPFPKDIIVSEGATFPPKLRHLQLRFDTVLKERLKFRSDLTAKALRFLKSAGFTNVETPVLFKSTPEGAREFLVPTRRPGFAYALPQSPQQYKQMLMASGVRKYFQLARCFRDEDLRADRQPEFTQLDLEMSFATGTDVMALVEALVQNLYFYIRCAWRTREVDGQLSPTPARAEPAATEDGQAEPKHGIYPLYITPDSSAPTDPPGVPSPSSEPRTKRLERQIAPFARITYHEAMSLYGSDKPDLRIPNKIQRIEDILSPSFTSMISDLEQPVVEACVFRFQDPSQVSDKSLTTGPEPADLKTTQSFITSVWDNLPKPLGTNPDGQPVPILIDSSKPLSGLSSLGHESAAALLSSTDLVLNDGDLLVIQARPNTPFVGGSTALGTLRKHIYDEAVAQQLLPFDNSFHFLWVTSFPLFTPNSGPSGSGDPGQGGAAGFASTHHPFTAPLTPADFSLLAADPLAAKADHYDLVVNGVELGGGSRRIHVAAVQEYVFRRVLKMSDAGVEHFSHLLEALRAGCPPHAGFAFGWDRLCATLGYTGNVRDVIAFPKSKRGEEPMARVPGRVGAVEWAVYGLKEAGKE